MRSHSNTLASLVVALILLPGAQAARAAIYTVGAAGTGCTHTTIQAALNAAETSAGADTVRITRSQAWTNQQLFVNTAQDLSIVGGFATCTATASDGVKTLVSADGPNNYSVFNVSNQTPSRVRFRLLRLTGGRAPSGNGGGLNYVGNGEVELIEMAIDGNRASYGGGIYFQGNGNDARLTISNDNLINSNIANVNGGGIYIVRAEMTMNAPGSSVANNTAVGAGGGLRIQGGQGTGTEVTVGSNGFGGLAAIYGNEARIGGGVSVQGLVDDGTANADFTLASGARIADNFASERGGAIDLQNYVGFNNFGDVYAYVNGGVLDRNSAPQASAVYVGYDTDGLGLPRGSNFQFNGGQLLNHISADASNNPTGGATVVVAEEARAQLTRVRIQGNVGGAVLRGDQSDDVVPIAVSHSLISSNTVQRSVLEALNGAPIHIIGNTIAGNTIGANAVLLSGGAVSLRQSIVWQPGKQTLDGVGARTVDDVLASELPSLAGSMTVLNADPRFIDPARGDYHLQAASPAVDFSGVTAPADLEGNVHDDDMALVANRYGAGDIGAYELQAIGNLVLNPGFLEDLRLWPVVTPNVSSWTAPGASGGPGSVLVSYHRSDLNMPPAGVLVGLSQCVHIPGPGTYTLRGFAYGEGSQFERDQVSLRWTLRNSPGTEACSGSASAEGTVPFPPSASFVATANPASIQIPAGAWTPTTNVELRLAVVEGSVELLTTTAGHFDGIVLEASTALPDALFANGFE